MWIRVLAVAQAAGWVALLIALGVRGNETAVTWAFLAVAVVVVPYLALRPSIRLEADGGLRLRGWFTSRRAQVGDISRLALTTTGLRFEFRQASAFTSVIFQATMPLRSPRVFEFVGAITGNRPDVRGWDPMRAAREGGIQLIPARPWDYGD